MSHAAGPPARSPLGTYPFGGVVKPVVQRDRSPKPLFVLGVYASAVHARWFRPGQTRPAVQALAVASEPSIFWTGERTEAASIIASIPIPAEAGRLEPAEDRFNGPSGRTLDEAILAPLGPGKWSRRDAWLADLVPHTLLNPGQQRALATHYAPYVTQGAAPVVTCSVAGRLNVDDARRRELAEEIDESHANVLIVLGDEPIRHFLRPLGAPWSRLANFAGTSAAYGRRYSVTLSRWPAADGGFTTRTISVVPIAHPRWISRLGRVAPGQVDWTALHAQWIDAVAPTLLRDLER